MTKRLAAAAWIWILFAFAPCAWPAAMLTTDPMNGRIFGPPGSTVSWDFTITNDADYIVPISLEYVDPIGLGAWTAIYFDFQVLGPGAPGNTLQGAFYYTIDAAAPPGASSWGGYLSFLYDRYSTADLTEQIGFFEEATADASVWVTPEPSTWSGIGMSGIVFMLVRRKARRQAFSFLRTRIRCSPECGWFSGGRG